MSNLLMKAKASSTGAMRNCYGARKRRSMRSEATAERKYRLV